MTVINIGTALYLSGGHLGEEDESHSQLTVNMNHDITAVRT